jgi:hypothetical protein
VAFEITGSVHRRGDHLHIIAEKLVDIAILPSLGLEPIQRDGGSL